MESNMFCYQCQETAKCSGCTISGVCGKKPEVARMQDLLIYVTKGLSAVTTRLREEGTAVDKKVNHLVTVNLFTTITNANFDLETITKDVEKTLEVKADLLKELKNTDNLPDAAAWTAGRDEFDAKAATVGVLSTKSEDIRSLRELITYGLKGLAAYSKHANALLEDDEDVDAFIQKALTKTLDDSLTVDDLVALTLETGKYGVQGMALLDKANTEAYGNPEITTVDIGVRKNPGILISGHDLKDLEMLLEQTQGTGVDVYTHSEMLPANYYPDFKKYDHFHGNYGSSWWKQNEEFEKFNGPILMTTNCIVPPKKESTYLDRLFTTSNAAYPGAAHIEADENGNKDFSKIIEIAKKSQAPTNLEDLKIVGGFAHKQTLGLADKVIDQIQAGNIRKFIVMAGCDGRSNKRSYYEDFAKKLPDDTVILTAGCAKYRYNKLGLGDINGIPRVLDAGQCNDSYSLVKIALGLKDALGLESINDLPIEYNIAWYEQKAVIVLLSLLALGVENIHLGPTLPAFLSETVVDFLVENFNLSPNTTVEEDMEAMGLQA